MRHLGKKNGQGIELLWNGTTFLRLLAEPKNWHRHFWNHLIIAWPLLKRAWHCRNLPCLQSHLLLQSRQLHQWGEILRIGTWKICNKQGQWNSGRRLEIRNTEHGPKTVNATPYDLKLIAWKKARCIFQRYGTAQGPLLPFIRYGTETINAWALLLKSYFG